MADEREKKKQDMLADMMASIETVSHILLRTSYRSANHPAQTGSGLASRDLRSLVERIETNPGDPATLRDAPKVIRQHLLASQTTMSHQQEKIRQFQEDFEMLSRKQDELEDLLAERSAAYDHLLGERLVKRNRASYSSCLCFRTTIRWTTRPRELGGAENAGDGQAKRA